MKLYRTLVISFAVSTQAFAGWTSGGGELATDVLNPWFLEKTAPKVQYCIQLDSENFGTTLEEARAVVQKSLGYWTEHFRAANKFGWNKEIKIGALSYDEVSCTASHDLAFQFGTLDDEQLAFVKDPTKFVGLAVRTDYDSATMKGKGFIYISPQRGPFALKDPSSNPHRWTHSNKSGNSNWLLQLVLVHELGHIFGMQHNGGSTDLMGETFPDSIASRGVGPEYLYYAKIPKLVREFGEVIDGGSCMLSGAQRNFFGLNSDIDCLAWKISDTKVEFFGMNKGAGTTEKVGEANSMPGDQFHQQTTFHSSTIVLPAAQTLFPTFKGQTKVQINSVTDGILRMTYKPVNTNIKRDILVHYDRGSVLFTGATEEAKLLVNFIGSFGWN